jgi:hypothetical protein
MGDVKELRERVDQFWRRLDDYDFKPVQSLGDSGANITCTDTWHFLAPWSVHKVRYEIINFDADTITIVWWAGTMYTRCKSNGLIYQHDETLYTPYSGESIVLSEAKLDLDGLKEETCKGRKKFYDYDGAIYFEGRLNVDHQYNFPLQVVRPELGRALISKQPAPNLEPHDGLGNPPSDFKKRVLKVGGRIASGIKGGQSMAGFQSQFPGTGDFDLYADLQAGETANIASDVPSRSLSDHLQLHPGPVTPHHIWDGEGSDDDLDEPSQLAEAIRRSSDDAEIKQVAHLTENLEVAQAIEYSAQVASDLVFAQKLQCEGKASSTLTPDVEG